ncbi:MAG: glycyl-radical enzyme activating protein [Ignavibacteria bacterium]|nr:glycyl-radical enzyme activating protein [Ignavibacteria bacterium]
MKGLIFDIKRFSVHDGPGIRTTVFFKGCPMECIWCHNPESRRDFPENVISERRIGEKIFPCKELIGKGMSTDEIISEIERDNIFYEESDGGVTVSGGEPLLQFDFLMSLLSELKKSGYHVALDTTGFTDRNNIEAVSRYTDLFLYDIKHMVNEEHIRYTGVPNTGIFDNLRYLLDSDADVILRIPVIPGINDTTENISMLENFIAGHNDRIQQVHLLPFHNIAGNKYEKVGIENAMRSIHSLSNNDLRLIKSRLEKTGVKVKTGG